MSTAIAEGTGVIPEGTWKSDPIHSWVGFQVRHMAVSNFRGELPSFDVTVTSDDASATLEGSAPVDQITTREENLTAHLASPDFFDSAQYPEITLASNSIGRAQDGALVLEGVLTIKGISKPVTLRGTISEPAENPYGMTLVGIVLEGVIDRTDWNMNWQAPLPGGGVVVSNDVTVRAELELVKQ